MSFIEKINGPLKHQLAKGYDSVDFLRDFAAVLYDIRYWIVGLLLAITAKSAIEPSVAWVAKEVVGSVGVINTATIMEIFFSWGLIYLAIQFAKTIFGATEKILDKLIEVRLLITLQRLYLDRRVIETTGLDTAQVLFGSRIANKGFETIYKDLWKIISSIVSVLIWQLSLGREWVLIMLLSVIAPLILVWKLGPYLQRYSHQILDQHEALASSTQRGERIRFEKAQTDWMYSSMRFHVVKWLVDEGFPLLLWSSLAILVTASFFLNLPLIPQNIEIAAATAAAINLKLLAKPLKDIGKVYAHWREAYPAMMMVFLGGDLPKQQ